MAEKKETTRTSGKLYNGVTYEREVTTYTNEDGKRRRRTVTDYTRGERTARVIEHSGYCSIGRENAEMFQVKPTIGRTRTYKHADNAKAKAVELVLGK